MDDEADERLWPRDPNSYKVFYTRKWQAMFSLVRDFRLSSFQDFEFLD